MKRITIVCISILLMASTCRKEGSDCHRKITIINKSDQDIVQALNFKNTSGKCILSGSILKPDSSSELRLNECWESSLADGHAEEIFIVDPNHFNVSGVFYDCDSIEIKNTVLKHFILNLDDLQSSNFTVSYP